MNKSVSKTEEYWKKKLTSGQYYILRKRGTELPFTGKYNLHKEKGSYFCAGCGTKLFSSDTKFESNCGWPAFFAAISKNIKTRIDNSFFGIHQIEVICKKCNGHLGHVYDDGPKDKGGKRFCINSLALDFKANKKKN